MITAYAEHCGDSAPTSVQYVRGSRGGLNHAFNAEIGPPNAATPAVLVQAVGQFTTLRRGIVPEGAPQFMSGTAISLVINDETGQVTDRSFGPRPIELSRFGSVVELA